MDHNVKIGLDVAAIANAAVVFIGWLPNIAAGLSVIWLLIQIYDWMKKKKK